MTYSIKSFSFVVLTVAFASVISMFGGIGLEVVSKKILPLIPLLVALPALNDLVGDYASIIAAHTGDKSERKKSHKELFLAIVRVIGFNIIAISILSIVVSLTRGYMLTLVFFFKFLVFIAGSILTVVAFMFWLNRVLDKLLAKSNINPDDVLIPVGTSFADAIMLFIVALAVTFIF